MRRKALRNAIENKQKQNGHTLMVGWENQLQATTTTTTIYINKTKNLHCHKECNRDSCTYVGMLEIENG